MAKVQNLDPSVIGILLVGAEGCSETQHEPWIRDATTDEHTKFIDHCREMVKKADPKRNFDFGVFAVDDNGRPYWLKVIMDNFDAPEIVKTKATRYTRVLRLTE